MAKKIRKSRKRVTGSAMKPKRKYSRRMQAAAAIMPGVRLVTAAEPFSDAVLATEFGPIVMAGLCTMCTKSLALHFTDGRFVGCGEKHSDSLFVPLFVPPLLIPSVVLNGILQSRNGTIIHSNGNGNGNGARPRMERRPAPATTDRRSSRAPLLFAVKDDIGEDQGEKTKTVFAFVNQHKSTGITLKSLVDNIKLPYSTVQSQVNKLLALKAIAKRAQPAA